MPNWNHKLFDEVKKKDRQEKEANYQFWCNEIKKLPPSCAWESLRALTNLTDRQLVYRAIGAGIALKYDVSGMLFDDEIEVMLPLCGYKHKIVLGDWICKPVHYVREKILKSDRNYLIYTDEHVFLIKRGIVYDTEEIETDIDNRKVELIWEVMKNERK